MVSTKDYNDIKSLALYLRRIKKISSRISNQDLDDIIQESAICLYRQRKLPGNNIKLTPIIMSRYNDFVRKDGRRDVKPEENTPDYDGAQPMDIDTKAVLLRHVLTDLPEYEQWILYKYYWEGYTHEEIAEMLDKSRAGVGLDIARAIRLMRRAIQRKPYRIE